MQINQRRFATVLFLVAIFWIPFFAAWYYFDHPNVIKLKTTNHGVLIQPTIALKTLGVHHVADSIKNKWLFIYVPSLPCDQMCENMLHNQRQIWIALNKNSSQVQRAILLVGSDTHVVEQLLKKYYPDMIKFTTSSEQFKYFLQQLSINKKSEQHGWILLVDPQQQVMMYYPATVTNKDVYDDLTHLLNINQA